MSIKTYELWKEGRTFDMSPVLMVSEKKDAIKFTTRKEAFWQDVAWLILIEIWFGSINFNRSYDEAF